MADALRDALAGLKLKDGEHTGLTLYRYFRAHKEMLSTQQLEAMVGKYLKTKDEKPEAALVRHVAGYDAAESYRRAFDRWKKVVSDKRWLRIEGVTSGSLAVGLGNDSPLENGLTIHHTYGMPVIPGSAVKGVCVRTAKVWGADEDSPEFKALFGTQESAGCFTFHDAWYDPHTQGGRPFHRDVITVHHQNYYSKRGNGVWPTDFDDPIPIPFLVVRPGARFLFAVQCPSDDWSDLVRNLLQWGLQNFGIGAKTNAGYGRFAFGTEGDAVERRVAGAFRGDANRPGGQFPSDSPSNRGPEQPRPGEDRPAKAAGQQLTGAAAARTRVQAPPRLPAKASGKSGAFEEWVEVVSDEGTVYVIKTQGGDTEIRCKEVPGRYLRPGDWDGKRFKAVVTYANGRPVSARWKSWR